MKYTSSRWLKVWTFVLLTIFIFALYKNLQIGSIVNIVGFWVGIYDGLILPIRLIGGLFGADIIHFMNPTPDKELMYVWGYLGGVGGAGIITHVNRLIDLIFKIIK